MGRTILCKKCKSTFNESVLANRDNPNICPICGESLLAEDDNNSIKEQKEKTKWYYYKEGGGTLMKTLSSCYTPLYTFEAIDVEDAKRQLKEVLPNNPLVNDDSPDVVRCPRCRSTQVQIVPRKFSLLTGFATNKFDRICLNYKKKF